MPKKDQYILWKPLFLTTVIMFLLVLVFWLVYPPIATLLLFSILCLWSRVPAMVSWFTKDTDVIDFFVVFIAINIGGVAAGIFGFINMLFSRIFGPLEDFEYTLKDGIAFLIGGFITPIIYYLTGENLLLTMYLFTIIARYGIYILQDLIFTPAKTLIDLGLITAGIPIAYFSNTFLTVVFGNTLNDLFRTGMNVNPKFFFGVTAVMFSFLLLSRLIEKGEHKVKSYEKYKEAIQPHFMQEPHKIFFSYFHLDTVPLIISGSFRHFKIKLFLITFGLMAAILINARYVPKWYEVLYMLVFFFIIVNLFYYGFTYLFGNKQTRQDLFR